MQLLSGTCIEFLGGEGSNHNEEVKDSVEGVDDVEDIVGSNAVLEVVDQEENSAFQVNVEDDNQVELCHF